MTRDELDPQDDKLTPRLESEAELPEEVAPDLEELAEGEGESGALDVEPKADNPAAFDGEDFHMENAAPEDAEAYAPDLAEEPQSSHDIENQKAFERFFEAYRAQKAAERAAASEGEADLLPADAPLRRTKDGFFYAEPRRLPPPTPFEALVFGFNKPLTPEASPDIQERWLPPEYLPKGSQPPAGSPPVPPPEPEIKVVVEVRLTSEARERIAELAIAKAAQTHQNHTEIVAKRLYELTREIRDREAARRVLYRR